MAKRTPQSDRPLSLQELAQAGYRMDSTQDQEAAPAAPESTGTLRRILQDGGISLLKGAIAVPEAAVGLADIATGGQAGKLAEEVGFRPKDAKAFLDEQFTPETKEALRKVQAADGFVDTVGTALANPSAVLTSIGESLPSVGAGGVIGRGVMAAAPKLAQAAPRMAALLGRGTSAEAGAAAIGEGVVGAGQAAEQYRQATEDGLLTGKQAALAGVSGVGDALFGLAGGKMANKLGIGDIDTMAVRGMKKGADGAQAAALDQTKRGVVRKVLEGAVSEGLLEELPQSVQEQVLQNMALGKPLDEGVGQQAALGMLAGMAMGGAAGPLGSRNHATKAEEIRAEKLPDVGPMSRAVNANIEQTASDVERGALIPGLTAAQENNALTRMEGVMDGDQKDLKAQGRADNGPTPPVVNPGLKPGDVAASAEAGDSPFADRVLDLGKSLQDPGVQQAIKAQFGDQGMNEALYYLNAADNAKQNLPDRTRDNMLALAEAIVSRAVLQPVQQDAKASINPEQGPALGAQPAAPQIELDTTPTGTIRVDAQGNAAPEVRADQISAHQRAEEAASLGQAPKPRQPAPVSRMAALTNSPTPTGRLIAGADGVRTETAGEAFARQTQAEKDADLGLTPDVRRATATRNATQGAKDGGTNPTTGGSGNGGAGRGADLAGGRADLGRTNNRAARAVPGGNDASGGQGKVRDAGSTGPDAALTPAPIKTQAEAKIEAAKVGGTIKRVPNGWAVIPPAAPAPTNAPSPAAFKAGDQVTLAGNPWTVASVVGVTTKLTNDKGETKMVLAGTKTYAALTPVTGEQSNEQGQTAPAREGAQGKNAQQANPDQAGAAPEGSGANAVPAAGSAALQADGVSQPAQSSLGNSQVTNSDTAQKKAPESLAGKKIDDEWTGFKKKSGTLSIPRAEMPQIKAEHRGAMVNFLAARGITHEQAEVPAGDLKPTQAEFSPGKVEKAKAHEGGDRSILVSSDNHVLDGHHQWLAKRDAGEPVKVIRLDAPIKQLLETVKEFPSAEMADGATEAKEPAVAASAGKEADSAAMLSRDKKQPSIDADSRTELETERDKNKEERMARVQEIAKRISDKWANAPKVIVFDGMADPRLPDAIRSEDSKQTSQGASGEPEGVYFKGVTYLNAGMLKDEADVRRVLFHEALGHYGLRGTYGNALDGILAQIVRARPREVTQKARDYGFDTKSRKDVLSAAEEVLAEMAQSRPELGFVRRAVAAIRTFLRKIGLKNLRVTDDEIIRNYILPARRFVEQGGPNGPKGGQPKFSRSEAVPQTKAPEFKRWFGDSKVVNAQGEPLVVYHGTASKFNVFNTGRGAIYFAADREIAQAYADYNEDGDGEPIVVDAYLRVERPQVIDRAWADENMLDDDGAIDWTVLDNIAYDAEQKGHDGLILRGLPDFAGMDGDRRLEREYDQYIVFSSKQIKSAIGNNGQFDPSNADIRFSRSKLAEGLTERLNSVRGMALPAGYVADDFITSHGKLGWWQKTVGTPYNLAKKNPAFRRVFDAVQNFLGDVSSYATEAADLAPSILPKLDTLADLKKSPLSAADTKALSRPVFEGTLSWRRDEDGKAIRVLEGDNAPAGIVFKPTELRSLFNLTGKQRSDGSWDGQIGLYQEFRAATDESLRSMTVSEMVRLGGKDLNEALREKVMDLPASKAADLIEEALMQAAKTATSKARADALTAAASRAQELATRFGDLTERGYAPLSRFGTYSLDVLDDKGARVYFGLFESQSEANRMARKMRSAYPGAKLAQGTMSQEAFKLFSGVSPETMEIFGELLGLDATGDSTRDAAFQEYIKRSKATRSAMKRLIHRQGIAGFSEDAGRVLAGFIYSNARATSGNLHQGNITEQVQAIADTKGQGELADYAVKMADYVKNPQEEAQSIRGMMFAHFLGGSVASAIVNMTQPIAVTFPFLSQYGGVRAAAGNLRQAFADVAKGTTGDEALDKALKDAEEDGTVSPQEVFHLMAQAQGKGALQAGDGTRMGDALAKANNAKAKVMLAWGKLFGFAEQVNRRVTFIAAYRMAPAGTDPAKFAAEAVTETQFTYNKGNKPQWARGTLGSLLFTFKQYSVSYIELIGRMANSGPEGRKAALLAVAVLALAGGTDELPFMKDAEDVIDGVMLRLGYNFNTSNKRNEFLAGVLGKDVAQVVAKGVTGIAGMPIDLSGRLGMGNLIPGTGLLTKKQDYTQDVLEVAGPAAKLAQSYFKAAGSLAEGNVYGAMQNAAPTAAANFTKGLEMAATGQYNDTRGRKVLDTTLGEAIAKGIGFQPNSVAKVQEAARDAQRVISAVKQEKQEIAAEWAEAMAKKDQDGVEAARQRLLTWNRNNPEAPISRPKPSELRKRVIAMQEDRATRMAKTAPKEIRAQVKKELAAATAD